MGSEASKIEKQIHKSALLGKDSWVLPKLDPKNPSFCTNCMKPTRQRELQNSETIDLVAQPTLQNSSGQLERVFSENDSRTRVYTTEEWPSSAHGMVSITFKGRTLWGTGTLILHNLVLTAAHNLYIYEEKAYVDKVEFLPAINGHILPFGKVKVEEYFVPQEYVDLGREDYALLLLDTSIGNRTGYFGMSILDPKDLRTKNIAVTGYPSDKVKDKPKVYEMWEMKGKAADINQEMISYLIDTAPGQSGSGVWYEENGNYYVVGIHVKGTMIANEATLLTRRRYEQISQWIANIMQKKVEVNSKDFVQEVDFTDQGIGASGADILAEYKLKNLQQLILQGNQIGDSGAGALAKNTTWTNLQELDLSGNYIGDMGTEALGKNTAWSNLRQLKLANNRIQIGAKALARNTTWINLQHLNLSWNRLGYVEAEALAKNTTWINLRHLNLECNGIGDIGAQALAKSNSWTNLQQLNLHMNYIGDFGAKALAKNNSWVNLQQLDLSSNHFGDIGAQALEKNNSWANLKQLKL